MQFTPAFRIGHGFDVHGFKAGDSIILGGVKIPHTQAFDAHSDGDVLIHALCDALLGAAGLGDIGRHFPDSDERYRNIDSRRLLVETVGKLMLKGFVIGNVDLTLVAQTPRVAGYIDAMCLNLAADMGIDTSLINIKATTTEGLGFIGRKEGLAAFASVLVFGK